MVVFLAAKTAVTVLVSVIVVFDVVAITVRLDGRRKPETSHSCTGNTLFEFFSCSSNRCRFVGTSLILMSFVCLLISPFDISLNDLFRLSNRVLSTILHFLV